MRRAAHSLDDQQLRRPSAYLTCASLARELEMSESTVHEMVRRGVIPQPIKMSRGCVRWCWAEVEAALMSHGSGGAAAPANDPFLEGVRNVTSK